MRAGAAIAGAMLLAGCNNQPPQPQLSTYEQFVILKAAAEQHCQSRGLGSGTDAYNLCVYATGMDAVNALYPSAGRAPQAAPAVPIVQQPRTIECTASTLVWTTSVTCR
jgi:outer membrane murein-binding lipoprotein Lpp